MLVNGFPGNSVSIRDRGLLYGDGVFRTMRIANGKALHWPLHLEKLLHDCNALGISCPAEATLCAELSQVLAQHPDGVVKIIVTRGAGGRGYQPCVDSAATLIWDFNHAPAYPPEWAIHGIRVYVCDLRLSAQPLLAGVKHLNRLENVLAAAELSAHGEQAAEGLLLDTGGNLIEGVRSNLFLVTQGRLVTPDLSRCGVAGMQRGRVMAWALQHGVTLQVRDVTLEEALHADELFIVNSIIGLWPICELGPMREMGQRHWNHFPLASRIRHALDHS